MYARYRAEEGTWVSSSLSQLGYARVYGKDLAYGAYADIVLGTDGKPLKTPDRIVPGQEYLIPIGTAESLDWQQAPKAAPPAPFTPAPPKPWEYVTQTRQTPPFEAPVEPKPALNPPVTVFSKEPWTERRAGRWLKDRALAIRDLSDYPSFELQGSKPPSKVPREAVAYWLRENRSAIIRAEQHFHVSRLAIAGAIAWEALENPQAGSLSSVGPGKMHIFGEGGLECWPDAIELTGRMSRRTPYERATQMNDPETAIWYIAAAFDLSSELAAQRGWNIRNSPELLAQIYHAYRPTQWARAVASKPVDLPFQIVPGTMGKWVVDNRKYLEDAVGPPQRY